MLVRFNKRTIVGGTTYTPEDGDVELANDLADQVVAEGNGVVVGLGEYSEEARLVKDSAGNVTGLVGAGGAFHATLGSNVITIGNGGRVSNLADAIALRAAQTHTLLTTFTGSVSGTVGGTVDIRRIIPDSGTPLAAYAGIKGIGVRIGGSGPIVRAFISYGALELTTRYPIPQDYTSVQIDVYTINAGAIVLLPGTLLEDATENMQIPAFTTVSALVRRTAGIVKTGGEGTMFSEGATQNEIYFSGLYLNDARYGSNSRFWSMPNALTHANQPMCDYGVYDCACDTASQDMFYVSNAMANSLGGGFTLRNSYLRGTFDVYFSGPMRHLEVGGCVIDVVSNAKVIDEAIPSGIAQVGLGNAPNDYIVQNTIISDNVITCRAQAIYGVESSQVLGVDFRNGKFSSNLRAVVKNNTISCVAVNADAAGVVTGVRVENSSATTTPTFIVKDNEFMVSGSGGVVPTIATSNQANSPILRSGNVVIPGGVSTLGTNTTALDTY